MSAAASGGVFIHLVLRDEQNGWRIAGAGQGVRARDVSVMGVVCFNTSEAGVCSDAALALSPA